MACISLSGSMVLSSSFVIACSTTPFFFIAELHLQLQVLVLAAHRI